MRALAEPASVLDGVLDVHIEVDDQCRGREFNGNLEEYCA